MTAALALLAARAGKRVLAIDVDAKGDLAAALGIAARRICAARRAAQPLGPRAANR